MLILLPFVIIIAIIAVINHVYYADTKPIQVKKTTHVEKKIKDTGEANRYINKYIKK
jgi:hypothetical protein